MKHLFKKFALFSAACILLAIGTISAQRPMENLGRGVVAVRTGTSGVFVSWRLLGLDPSGIGFNLYRSTAGGTAVKLNSSVLTAGTNYTDNSATLSSTNAYYVKPVISGIEQAASGSYTLKANAVVEPCFTVQLNALPGTGYYTKFVWVGDLDGDGEFDYVIDRLAPFDATNNDIGLGQQYLEAYNRNGTRLWSINMGPSSTQLYNISPGAATISMGMYDGVTVYDMNSDGKAEVILKIADGVKFPNGTTFTNSDPNKQFISIVNGQTGNLISSLAFPTDFYAQAGKYGTQLGAGWNGSVPIIYGWLRNRNSDKSFNDIIVAWTWNGSTLSQAWKLPIPSTTTDIGCFHQMQIADVDGNGSDELLPGNFTINSNGTIRYKMPGIGHGDRHYVGKFDASRAGLQGYGIQQDAADFLQDFYYDANTGAVLWKHYGTAIQDMGRGIIGEVDPRYAGWEAWTFNYMTNARSNTKVSDTYPYPVHTFWWDGDLESENLNDQKFEKWDYANKTVGRLLTSGNYEGAVIAGHNPMLSGDLIGDWRTEVVEMSSDYRKLVIFTTDIPTTSRIYTMAQNPEHRSCMTVKGYYESPLVDYFIGTGMATPPEPNIRYVGGTCTATPIVPYIQVNGGTWQNVSAVSVASGATVILGPNPISGGSWSWTGCGTSGTAREQTLIPTSSCTATATYTNDCGVKSTQNFVITVNSSTVTSTYQAENYTAQSGVVVATNQAGYTGTGFVDYGVSGSWIEWNNVSSTNGGSATLTFTYANASSTPADRPCTITVNGVSAGTVNFVPTTSWTTWTPVSINVTLNAGNNAIRVTANTSTGGPNLDKMDVSQSKSAQAGDDIQQSNALIISPNPIEGGSAIVTVDLTVVSQLNISVINYLGKVVYQKNFGVLPAGKTNQVIDLTSLPKGSYIIRAQTANGNKTTKLIRL